MGYAQAFRLLMAGYKKIKGKMPEGLDLLKIKQEARKKAIDAQKVIKVNFDKANNWMKAKPQSTKVKGKAAETEAEMIARMNRQNKESVKRLKDKKEKSLGEKLRDYKGDPDAMATGGRVRFAQGGTQYTPTTASRMQNAQAASQATSPTTGIQNVPTAQLRNIQGRQAQPMTPQQFITANTKPGSQNTPTSLLNLYYRNSPLASPVGTLSLAEMDAKAAKILAEQQAQQRADSGLVDSVTGKRYISQQEAIDDLGIVVYNQRFADGGRVNFNTGGGVSNVVGTYLANPSLQDKYTQQEYEDFFGYGTNQPSTTTTTATNVVQPSRVASPIVPNIIKPIIPISEDGGDGGGGITSIDTGLKTADQYGFGQYGNNFNTADVQKEIDELNENKGLMDLLSLSPAMKTLGFIKNKAAAGKKQLDDFFTRRAEEKAAKEAAEAKLAAERNRIQQIIDSGSSVDRASGGQFGSSVNEATGARGSGTGFSNYS
tara:strand:+ start:865 stop:2325 length:1461 start_codon:yes stop_codon:yes gene_type:complete